MNSTKHTNMEIMLNIDTANNHIEEGWKNFSDGRYEDANARLELASLLINNAEKLFKSLGNNVTMDNQQTEFAQPAHDAIPAENAKSAMSAKSAMPAKSASENM